MFTRKKSKPIKKLSPLQEQRYLRIVVVLVLLVLLWFAFSPGSGLLGIWKKRSELKSMQEQNVVLEEENAQLSKEIEQLQNDPAFLEEVARQKYKLLKKNEKVFEFTPKKSAKEQ